MAEQSVGPYYNPVGEFKSKLRVVSIGVVAENKPMNTNQIKVVPIEMVPLIDGEIADAIDEYEAGGEDRNEQEYTVNIKASTTIDASWLQLGTNRKTAPDVRRGEQVLIWQYADQDRYFWQTMGMDDDLRRLETVVYAWSAEKDDNVELELSENMYSLEISSHFQHITLKTTDAEGEATTYKLQFNLKDGIFFLEDKQGNSITLNSVEHQIQARTTDECDLILDKEDLRFEVPGNIVGKVEKDADLQVEGDVTAVIKGNVTGQVEGDIDWVTEGSVRHQAPEMQFGQDDAVQPSTLGDNQAKAMEALIEQLNNSYVIGNLGAPTSTIEAGSGPVEATGGDQLKSGGDVYSTVNKNQ